LIVVKTNEEEVFGAFIEGKWRRSNRFWGERGTFLFQLHLLLHLNN